MLKRRMIKLLEKLLSKGMGSIEYGGYTQITITVFHHQKGLLQA